VGETPEESEGWGMRLFRGRGLECYNCVWHRTTESGETKCGIDNSLPYRSEIDGKLVKHPAWNCEYFIERHCGNECLEFTCKLRYKGKKYG